MYLIDHTRAQRLLVRLPLKDLLLNCADGEHPVDEALLLLPVPPHPRHRLLVVGRVPIRVEHHLVFWTRSIMIVSNHIYQAIGPDQVQATTTSFRGEHEDKLTTGWVVELIYHLRPLLNTH